MTKLGGQRLYVSAREQARAFSVPALIYNPVVVDVPRRVLVSFHRRLVQLEPGLRVVPLEVADALGLVGVSVPAAGLVGRLLARVRSLVWA